MRKFESSDPININSIRINPRQTNEVGNLSSLIGLWILLPLAISGASFASLQVIFTVFLRDLNFDSWQQVFVVTWYLISIVCQALYWMWITQSIGLSAFVGLWSLVPIFGWFKTFKFALIRVRSSNLHLGHSDTDLDEQVTSNFQAKSRAMEDVAIATKVSTKSGLVQDSFGLQIKSKQTRDINKEKFSLGRSFKPVFKFLKAMFFSALEVIKKYKKTLSTRKKLLLAVSVLVVASAGTYFVRPFDDEYRVKKAAAELKLELQEVMELSSIRPLEFSRYSQRLDPLIDEYLETALKVHQSKSTNCSLETYGSLERKFFELRLPDKFNLYPETIMGWLNSYVDSCG